MNKYTQNEQEIGTNNDGETIYRQTFSFGTISFGQDKTFSLPAGSKFVGVDSNYSFGENSDAGIRFPIPRTHDNSTLAVRIQAQNNIVTIACGSGVSFSSGIITVLYTKN